MSSFRLQQSNDAKTTVGFKLTRILWSAILGTSISFLIAPRSSLGHVAVHWEYLKVKNSKGSLSIDKLNKLGAACWELVACPVDDYQKSEQGMDSDIGPMRYAFAFAVAQYCIFKRPNPRSNADFSCPQ